MKRTAVCSALLAWFAFITPIVLSQDLPTQYVHSVRVAGLERISEQLVRSHIEVQAGDVYNPRAIARDIRRLYDLGHFTTISVDGTLVDEAIQLSYIFEEKQVIETITITGNKKLRKRDIRGVLSWREGDSFEPDAETEERQAVLKLYQSRGYPNATVDVDVETVGPSRVGVTYDIKEGKKARIKRIRFAGNAALSDRKLRKIMKTKERRCFLGGKYDEDKFETDLERVLDGYGDRGHLEADIAGTEFDYGKRGKKLTITVSVSEGPQYRVGTLETADNVVFDDEEIIGILRVQPGDVHNKSLIEQDVSLIERGYVDSGYVNGRVASQITLDREQQTTHVVYRIYEGDLKYVRQITITGNTTTKDEVIRREMMLLPGERFDGALLRATQRRLENTQFFDSVQFMMEDVEEDNTLADLLVDVEEGDTGQFSFGAGYSTEEKLGGYLELSLSNFDIANWPTFTGGGQQFSGRFFVGGTRDQISISFTDPEIGGHPLSFGFDVFDESRSYPDNSNFTENSQGLQLRLGKLISPHVRARTAVMYDDVDISDTSVTINPEINRLWDVGTTISGIWGLTRDTIDLRRDPSTGARHDVEFELAGFGGNNDFCKLSHDSTWYWSLDNKKKYVLSLRTRENWAATYGSSDVLPISERFFAGGSSTVRGYDVRDIGPKEKEYIFFGDDVAIGGELRLVSNLEVKYRLSKQLRLFAFVDAGGVWREPGDFSLDDLKYGAGLGFGIEVPKLGPIRIDYGIPINADPDQGSGRLHMMTGFRF